MIIIRLGYSMGCSEKNESIDEKFHVFYISGPMSGVVRYNFPLFDSVADHLRGHGAHVINPADLSRRIQLDGKEHSWGEFIGKDLQEMRTMNVKFPGRCVLVQLPGWSESDGAVAEHALAVKWGWRVLLAFDVVPLSASGDLNRPPRR